MDDKNEMYREYKALKRKVWLLNGSLVLVVVLSLLVVIAGTYLQTKA
ncbi:hypothetical protein OOT00_15950 [Desulfobotulus sp. H1]|uniref:Uncharacterized protein n=1 Tax=Desulfobotulus pelophilus TaxID=2823377 RepID=A0ABT3NDC8_9BACT|nr:hypothetical protein [Desulfobotulus pelophilus]MCW7755468.1 hypothetical protein [Desulfobotulus pelophilus]